ncbi:MAG: hypothetical protein A2234_05440 [Elusimicrobia bacterium RIFOXYA2_FULL_58_8]|nr:MAG: hypothetical protein A2285_02180 [Elusimicrobia bacterium RIFOXYA12_FULL_57_11]OGS17337.1 MAG: hypothetical protein A2234_05440 [Elusimicrobia bacterium RIFOXYA2_FULL_58_8]
MCARAVRESAKEVIIVLVHTMERGMGKLNYRSLAVLAFISAVLLRVLLCWANPPGNAFDNHFKPIFLIMDLGAVPAKDACWQCYQPPVFYWMSAVAGDIAVSLGMGFPQLLKLFQFISCFYGILTVGVVYLILRKLPLSDFARLISFGVVCFLPRHIYMSAMNSNDTMSYLFVALSIYLLLTAIERGFDRPILVITGIIVSITLFTKYTTYVMLPVILVTLIPLSYGQTAIPRRRVLTAVALVFLVPLAILGVYFADNVRKYGDMLPSNVKDEHYVKVQPRDSGGLDFFSFKPWESITAPVLVPGKMHSVWTLVYGGMWFDNEPKFLYYLDLNSDWWTHYAAWLKGEGKFPGENPAMSKLARLTGAGLAGLGLLPLLLGLTGVVVFFRKSRERWGAADGMDAVKMNMFPVLLSGNAASIMALALKSHIYGSVKASYFLNSLPAFAVFLGLGLMACEENRKFRISVSIVFAILFALAGLHILHIFSCLSANPELRRSFLSVIF